MNSVSATLPMSVASTFVQRAKAAAGRASSQASCLASSSRSPLSAADSLYRRATLEEASCGSSSRMSTTPEHISYRCFSTSASQASGSNKWSKIRHKKQANDTARGNAYGLLSSEIMSAIRNHPTHASTPEMNARLAGLLRKAREMDIPKDKLEATIKKAEAAGSSGGANGTSIIYEAMGPNSKEGVPVALIVECNTDSPARTRAKVKEAFNKNGIRLTSTSHLFERKGVIRLLAKEGTAFDDVFMAAVEHGAEEVREWEDYADETDESAAPAGVPIEVVCDPSSLQAISSALAAEPHNHALHLVESQMLPVGSSLRIEGDEEVPASDGDAPAETADSVSEADVDRLDKLVAALQETADCERVWSNIAGWPAR